MSKQKIHFIAGIWRSGTTLMKEVLGMKPEVKVFPEHMIALNNLKWTNRFTESKSTMLNNVLNNPDFVHFAEPNSDKLKEDFARAERFEEGILACYNACLKEAETIELFIDKNPIYSYYLPELLELFPDSKIVWMLREPKDNCISRAKYNIQSFKNYGYLAHWWNETNQQIAKQALAHPDRFLLVHYDAMVQQPKEWVEKICSFLEIQFTDDMLAFEKKKDERIQQFVKSAKARDGELKEDYAKQKAAMWENLQKPINSSKVKQWEKELNQKQIETVDYYTKDFYEALLKGDYSFSPKTNLLQQSLMKASLYKLKQDIKHLKKV